MTSQNEDELEQAEREREAAVAAASRSHLTPSEREKHGAAFKWKLKEHDPETGAKWEMPELVEKFLREWCLKPASERQFSSQQKWAEHHGVTERTVQRWKKDPKFVRIWKDELDTTWGHPEFLEPVIDQLQRTATSNGPQQVAAAKLLLEYLRQMAPQEVAVKVTTPKAFSAMSDEELARVAGLQKVELSRGDS